MRNSHPKSCPEEPLVPAQRASFSAPLVARRVLVSLLLLLSVRNFGQGAWELGPYQLLKLNPPAKVVRDKSHLLIGDIKLLKVAETVETRLPSQLEEQLSETHVTVKERLAPKPAKALAIRRERASHVLFPRTRLQVESLREASRDLLAHSSLKSEGRACTARLLLP